MVKNIFIAIFLEIIPILCIAQKQGNIWYFGKQSGLDFSTGTPVVLSNGQTATDISVSSVQEGTASIADSAGKLLFYTGGQTIWNRNHIPMANGAGLMGHHSSTQSSVIVPLPGSDSLFYVFTSDQFQNFSTPPQNGYRYSIVDMCQDSGNGDVISGQKNILLADSSTEKLNVCEDANGTGYWIVGHKMFSNEFQSWHLTSGGITNTIISNTGTIHGWNNSMATWSSAAAQGQMKINALGTKLALAIGNFNPAILDVFDFNSNTGVVSNPCHIVVDSVLNKRVYGIEFSPDGTKMYTAVFSGSGGRSVYQYDLTAGGGNCDSIIAKRFTLFQSNGNFGNYGMQLAPNGKIYLARNSQTELSCIHFPNLTGLSANFDSSAIVISGTNYYTLPSFIAGYKYHNGIACQSGVGITEQTARNTEIALFPNPNTGHFIIYSQSTLKFTQIEIFNSTGEKIQEMTMDSKLANTIHTAIDLSKQPAGMYFLRVETESGIINKKVIVTK